MKYSTSIVVFFKYHFFYLNIEGTLVLTIHRDILLQN
jgi:hypothetical protein